MVEAQFHVDNKASTNQRTGLSHVTHDLLPSLFTIHDGVHETSMHLSVQASVQPHLALKCITY
jgi:hypothetical protein